MTDREMEYWAKYAERLLEGKLHRPASPQVEGPRCARCGGQPHLGHFGRTGKLESYCRRCADEEYLESLTPEERELLRNV